MKQALHIFAKDARHQWLEILLSTSLVAAMALTARSQWHGGAMLYGEAVSFSPLGLVSHLPGLLTPFVPLGWWLLISPAIHEEKLVGDRQFWITRPYGWKSLLAAKMLFLIVFIFAPLLLAQLFMLAQAGFSPFRYFPGLLYDLLLLACVLVLPLVALATVTRNFARMTLALLGAVVCFIVIMVLDSNASPDWVQVPHADSIIAFLAVAICIAVIVLQYARRGPKASWFLLGLLVVLFGGFSLGRAPDNAQVDRTYPPPGHATAAAQFAYREAVGPSALVTQGKNRVGISIPVQITGIADGTIVFPELLKVTLQTSNGIRWTSVWQFTSMDRFFPGQTVANARFTMPRAQYDALKGLPLKVDVLFAMTQARAGDTRRMQLSDHDFNVPGLGVCSPFTGLWGRPGIDGIECRAPLRQPNLTFIQAAWYEESSDCKSAGTDPGIQTSVWIGSLERGPADFGLIPIWSSSLNFTNQFKNEGNRAQALGPRKLCPGTPLTFTEYNLSGRSQTTLSINGFQLPDLNRGQLSVMDHDTQ